MIEIPSSLPSIRDPLHPGFSDAMSESNPTADRLASHAGWIRALARELVSSPDSVDDLTQETIAIALEKAPRDPVSLKSWLGTVVRNLWRERVRSRGSRLAREESSARPEGTEPTDEIVARMQAEQDLGRTLMELDEPYRSTLFLRFYDDLPPREIAERQGVPVATVKSRLSRGLAHMRARLDAAHGGDRQAWMLVVLPFAMNVRPETALTLGGLAVNSKLTAAAVATVVVAGAWMTLSASDDGDDTLQAPAHAAAPEPEAAPAAAPAIPFAAEPEPEETARTEVARAESAAPATETTQREERDATRLHIQGRALDGQGVPIPGLELRLRDTDTVVAETNANGRFAFDTEAERGRIESAMDAWVTIRAGAWSGAPEIEPVVVVAPKVDLAGEVVDEWGNPLEDARVRVALPEDFNARFDAPLDASTLESWAVGTDAEGRFWLDDLPAVPGAMLRATHARYEPSVIEVPQVSDGGLRIQLELPIVPLERALSGQVVHADGSPAPEAYVSLGAALVPTDSNGNFTIDVGRILSGWTLKAIAAGHQPGVLESSGSTGSDLSAWPDPLVVVLGPPTLSIEGRVVDADGEPVAGARVWPLDPGHFGILGNVPLQTEAMMAGAPLPAGAIEFLADRPTEDGNEDFGNHSPLYGSTGMLHYVTTDADGEFVLEGLADRSYRLAVLGPDLGRGTRSDPIRAGTRETIEIPAGTGYERLRGRVVTRSGEPVAGVNVQPFLSAVSADIRLWGGEAGVSRFFLGESAQSDEDGVFVLEQVLKESVSFYLTSDTTIPTWASVDDVEDPDDFEIVVKAHAHVSVELLDPFRADHISISDFDGGEVTMRTMRVGGHTTYKRLPFSSGRTATCVVSTDAAQLHLWKDGVVVESHAVELRAGVVNTIRL